LEIESFANDDEGTLIFLKGMTFVVYSPIITRMTGLNVGLPVAWVVRCKKCGCTINCRAIDPQTEHSQPDKADPPPQDSVIVTCSCCWAAYRYNPAEIFKGAPGPSSNCYDRGRPNNKEEKKPNAVLVIAASLIAAVRLNREEIKSSPSVHAKIADSIRLAEMIQARLRG
jgi:hypothetical protein